MKGAPLQLRLTDELESAVRTFAEENHLTVAEAMRELLGRGLGKTAIEVKPQIAGVKELNYLAGVVQKFWQKVGRANNALRAPRAVDPARAGALEAAERETAEVKEEMKEVVIEVRRVRNFVTGLTPEGVQGLLFFRKALREKQKQQPAELTAAAIAALDNLLGE